MLRRAAAGLAVVEEHAAVDHIGGDGGHRPSRSVRVRSQPQPQPQPQPQQSVGEAEAELDRDHSGGLVYLGSAVDRPGERGVRTVVLVVVLQVQHHDGGRVGEGQGIGQLRDAELSGSVAVEVEDPDVNGADPQRKGEMA